MNIEKLLKDLKSWKTTAFGFIGGLILLLPQIQTLLDNDPATTMDMKVVITALTAMGIGVAAKDGDKSTEDVSKKSN